MLSHSQIREGYERDIGILELQLELQKMRLTNITNMIEEER